MRGESRSANSYVSSESDRMAGCRWPECRCAPDLTNVFCDTSDPFPNGDFGFRATPNLQSVSGASKVHICGYTTSLCNKLVDSSSR
jgi:hypothetical protein